MRWIAGFVLAVLAAYLTVTAVLVVLSWTHHGLAKLPLMIAVFPMHVIFSLVATGVAGFATIPLFLGLGFAIATFLPRLSYRFELAGLAAALAHVASALLLNLTLFSPRLWATPLGWINQGAIIFAILVAGLVAGRAFHKVAYPEMVRADQPRF